MPEIPQWKQLILDRYNELKEQKTAIDLEYKEIERFLKKLGLLEKKTVSGSKRGRKKKAE